LRKKLPVIYYTFLVGSASLAALPLITAGFYSKDQILWFAWSAGNGSPWLWLAGFAGAFITSLYTFRMVFLTFFGEAKTELSHQPGILMTAPLIILAVFSLIAGFIELPDNMGHVHLFSDIVTKVLPGVVVSKMNASEILFQVLAAVISLSGIYIAYMLYLKKPSLAESFNKSRINQFFYEGWGFDRLYDFLFVRPFVWLAEVNKNDFIDSFNSGLAKITLFFNRLLSITQNGKLRWYIMAFTIGIVFILTILMNL
jgi:NADH-quinone oxidoreductase subunit L